MFKYTGIVHQKQIQNLTIWIHISYKYYIEVICIKAVLFRINNHLTLCLVEFNLVCNYHNSMLFHMMKTKNYDDGWNYPTPSYKFR